MILVGLSYEWINAAGHSRIGTHYFEAEDIHEAASGTWKSTWTTPFQCMTIKGGEFHDTETHNTWSVDSGGHTKKDYRRESEKSFINRWST